MNIYSDYEDEINKHYQIVDVTQNSIDFLLARLKYGQILSNLVARYVPVEIGKVETFTHRSIEKHKLIQFERGGIGQKLPENFNNFPKDDSKWAIDPVINFFVAPIIQEFLAKKSENVCILEHIDARPSDTFMKKSKDDPIFTLTDNDSDVYYFIDDKDTSIVTIREAFDCVTSWSEIVFLSSMTNGLSSLRKSQKIDLENLEKIAKRTEKIIISAYDGEGYLIWIHPDSTHSS